MLMAAGLGTRLRPFTDRLPKPLLPLMGVPMAQYALDRLAKAGVTKVVANYSHLPEITRSGLARLERHGMELRMSDESSLLLGSAGGIAKALPLLGPNPFYLVNSDVICDVNLRALSVRHARLRDRWGVTMTLTLFPRGPIGGTYSEIFSDVSSGLITGLGPKQSRRPFFVGSAVLEPEAAAGIPTDQPGEFVPLILERAIRAGKCGFMMSDGMWLDVGSPTLWLEAHVALMDRMETGCLPVEWRKRIELTNERIAAGIWAARGASARRRAIDWAAPAYWGAGEEVISNYKNVPRQLGPHGVFYGREHGYEEARAFKHGIGLGDDWVDERETLLG